MTIESDLDRIILRVQSIDPLFSLNGELVGESSVVLVVVIICTGILLPSHNV